MNVGEKLVKERNRRRRDGDPRLSDEGRELFRRMSSGDLVDEFQMALDADVAADTLLGQQDNDDEVERHESA